MHTQIIQLLQDHSHPDRARAMEAYQKNNFTFFGIPTPFRRALLKSTLQACKALAKDETFALAKALWQHPNRECHYVAQELLWQNLKKTIEKKDINNLEYFLTHQSWWDTVDFISPKLITHYFIRFPEQKKEILARWVNSNHRWLIRAALLCHLKTKEETDISYLFSLILSVSQTKEFFINKAIGWVLREHAKRIPEVIYSFIEENKARLAPLSIREGLKHA